MNRLKFTPVLAFLSLGACGNNAPPEPAVLAPSAIEVSPPIVGYFSIGDMEVPPVESRMVSALQEPANALVVARIISRDEATTSRVTFPSSGGGLTEYEARSVRLRVVRVVDDPSRVLAATSVAREELTLHVVNPSAVRHFDRAGGLHLPFPGSQSPLEQADTRAAHAESELAAVVSMSPRGSFLVESAEMSGDTLVGDHERIPLIELVQRASALREGRH